MCFDIYIGPGIFLGILNLAGYIKMLGGCKFVKSTNLHIKHKKHFF